MTTSVEPTCCSCCVIPDEPVPAAVEPKAGAPKMSSISRLVLAVGAGLAMAWLTDFLASQGVIAAVDPNTDRVVELTDPAFATSPLIAAAVALVIIAAPWVSQQWRRVLWTGVALLVVFRVVSSTEAPLDIVVAIAVGMAVGSLALLAGGAAALVAWRRRGARTG